VRPCVEGEALGIHGQVPRFLVVLFALSGKGITEHPFRVAEVNGGKSPRSKRSQGGLPL